MNSYLTLQQSFCTTRYASEKKNGKRTPKEQNSQNKAKYNRNPHKQKPPQAETWQSPCSNRSRCPHPRKEDHEHIVVK
ncbi:hypothetical protein ABE205_09885 [Brevibacillus agri]|uniref:hypothetical protein n=1 Tax=Brevibacillus agri TaxID=51101 RepID=UPI003D230290